MVSRVFSAGLSGIDGYIVTVECSSPAVFPGWMSSVCRPARYPKPESASVPAGKGLRL